MAYKHAEALEWFDDSLSQDAENRDDFSENERYLAGDQWPESEKKARGDAAVVVNKLDSTVLLICNQVAQSLPGPKISRRDEEDSENTAEVLEGILRDIQYNSNAPDRYMRQLDYATGGNIGILRLYLAYVDPSSMDRELRIGDLADPQMCVLDPGATEPDKSDMRRFVLRQKITCKDYEQRYGKDPKKGYHEFSGTTQQFGVWYDLPEDWLWIAEDWIVEHDRKKLLRVNGKDIWEEELEKLQLIALQSGEVLQVEQEAWKMVPRVTQRIIDGAEVLETNDWPGSTIPFFPVINQERYVNGKARRKSNITDARSSQRLFNYIKSQQLLSFKNLPSSKFLVGRTAMAGHEQQYRDVNNPDITVLSFNEYDEAGKPLPAPLFQQYQMDVQNYSIALQQTEDDIRQLTRTPPAALGLQQSASESGKKVELLQQQSGMMNSHAAAGLNCAVESLYRAAIEVIPDVYNAQQAIRIIGADDKANMVWVNQHLRPAAERRKDRRTGRVKMHDLSIGRYGVVASIGPDYQTKQQEAAERINELSRTFPQIVQEGPDIILQLLDLGPKADELIARVTPEKYKEQTDAPQNEQAMRQRLVQLDHACQAMEKRIQEMSQYIETDQAKQEAQLEIAQIQARTVLEKARLEIGGKMALEQLDARLDLMQKQLEQGHEDYQQRAEHAHEIGMEAVKHAGSVLQAEQLHTHAKDMPAPVSTSNGAQ